MGMIGAGAILKKNNATLPTLSIEVPSQKIEAHDTTPLSASAKAKIAGLPDAGEVKWTELYDDDTYESRCSAKGVEDDFTITFPDLLVASFNAFITEITVKIEPDSPILMELTAAVNGAISISNPS